MPKRQKSRKNSRIAGKLLEFLRRIFTINIGTTLFGVLFLYMLFSAIVYRSGTNYSSYQVISGPLSRNETYTGLALREETVVTGSLSGFVSYYAREGMKIHANGAVYGVSADKSTPAANPLKSEDLSKIRQQMSSFSNGFSMSHFNDTYSFKYELEGNILQYSGASMLPEEETEGENTNGGQTICKAPQDGIVLYHKDGYEGKTLSTLTAEDFDQNSYQKVNLKTQKAVKNGREMYTLITDERWKLLLPLSEKQAAKLADTDSLRVKFLKDGISQVGDFEITEIDGASYGILCFEKGLIRYASDRFLDIELVTNIQNGLKIPLTSIVNKEFYVIPVEYAEYKDNRIGFFKKVKNKESAEFISPTLYGKSEEFYYVQKSEISAGDILQKNKSSDRYTVSKTDTLDGVFCINKGYPQFRTIEILDQNEEFAIVEKGTAFGISSYDFIVPDESAVKEEDTIK